MSQKQKLLAHLISNPKDFTIDDATTLLESFGFRLSNKGKTSGSRIMFENAETKSGIRLHKPHPGKVLHAYQIKQLIEFLSQEDLL